ncbi:MAG: Ig-like domain-containing protein [Candidatus Woesearchaeota archaeon]
MTKRAILAILIFIAFLAPCTAIESFSISAASTINAYSCASTSAQFTIINNNPPVMTATYTVNNQNTEQEAQIPTTSSYTITVSGEASKWVAAAPSRFASSSGQEQKIELFMTIPCEVSGTKKLVITVQTDNGLSEAFKVQLNIMRSQNLRLIPRVNSASICPCTSAMFQYEIKNTGSFTEQYDIATDLFPQYTRASENPVTLAPGETRTVYLFTLTPCERYGSFKGNLKITAINNQLSAQTPYYLSIAPCYQYHVQLGELTPQNSTTFKPQTESYRVCQGTVQNIPLIFKNTAEMQNTYTINLRDESWARLNTNSITLAKNQSILLFINLNPSQASSTVLKLDVNTLVGQIQSEVSIPVSVENCGTPKFFLRQLQVNYSSQINALQIQNTGTKKTTYRLSIYGINWAEISPRSITLDAGQTAEFAVSTSPTSEISSGDYKATLVAATENAVYTEQLDIMLGRSGLSGALSTFLQYQWYLIGGILLLLVLFTVATIVARRRPRAEEKPKERIKAEGPAREPVKEREPVREEMGALEKLRRERLTEIKQEHKTRMQDLKKQEREQERKIKQLQKARVTEEKKRRKPKWVTWIFILFVIAALAGIGYYSYKIYKERAQEETVPTGAHPTFNISQPENETAQPQATIPITTRLREFARTYKTYLIIAGSILVLIVLLLLASKVEHKKRLFAWIILVLLIAILVFGYIKYKPRFTAKPEEQPLKNITQEEVKEVYEQDKLLQILANGTYGYNKTGNIVNIQTGELVANKDFIRLLEENKQLIISRTNITELELNLTIEALKRVSYGVPETPLANCTIKVIQDSELKVNLSKAFTDPDMDILSFSSTQPAHITAMIAGETATLIPEKGFTGTDKIEFFVEDTKGGSASSGELTICVSKATAATKAQGLYQKIKAYVRAYYAYIIAGFVILIGFIIGISIAERKKPDSQKKKK